MHVFPPGGMFCFPQTIIGAEPPGVKCRGGVYDPIESLSADESARDRCLHRFLLGSGKPRRSAVCAPRARRPAPRGEDPRHGRSSARRSAARIRADPGHCLRCGSGLVYRPSHCGGRHSGARSCARHRRGRNRNSARSGGRSGGRGRRLPDYRLPRCAQGRGVSCRLPEGGCRMGRSFRSPRVPARSRAPRARGELDRLRRRFRRLSRASRGPVGRMRFGDPSRGGPDRTSGAETRNPAFCGGGSEGRRRGGAGVSARQGRAQDERTLMSAVLRPAPSLEPMSEADLRAVVEIEEGLYEFPWTLGNFRDSLRAGYGCLAYRDGRQLIGYAVLLLAAGEAHLLNLSVAAHAQRRGHGRSLLEHVVGIAREREAKVLFLEVRPTNEVGRRLYTGYGFKQVGVRRGYYPARRGREDALVLARSEEHTSELQSPCNLVCRLLLEKKKTLALTFTKRRVPAVIF